MCAIISYHEKKNQLLTTSENLLSSCPEIDPLPYLHFSALLGYVRTKIVYLGHHHPPKMYF